MSESGSARNPAAGPAPDGAETHCGAGRRGEDRALDHLLGKGYRLLCRNFRHGRGEIDLIMEDPAGILVFVEVKANRAQTSGRPLERIDGRKIRRLQRLAQRYCWQSGGSDRDMRFDAVGVDLVSGGSVEAIEHIENAFLPDGAGYFPAG